MRWKLGMCAAAAGLLSMGAATPPAATGPARSPATAPAGAPVATAAVATAAAPSATASTYVDGTYGYKIHAPELSPGPSAPGVVIFRGPVINGFASNVNIQIQPLTSQADYDKDSDEGLQSHGAKVNSKKALKISGREAEMLDYEATISGQALHFLQLVVFDGDHVVLVTCTTTKEDFARTEAEFRKCLESFELPAKGK